MDLQKQRRIQLTLRQLAEDHARMVASCLAEALQALGSVPDPIARGKAEPRSRFGSSSEADLLGNRLLDAKLLSVVYHGKRCFLGNTLPFRVIEHLARCPNRYISYEILLDEVWHNVRSREAVRSVMKVLRAKLRSAGLSPVAAAIDGQVAGHYALMLDRLS